MLLNKAYQNLWFKLGLFLVSGFLAYVFGLISITNNPILIGLAVGLVFGLFLLAIPKIVILLVIALGLGAPSLINMLGSGFSRLLWAISMLAILLWLPGIINLFSFNPKQKKHTPFFIWFAIIFVLYAVIVTLMQLHSYGELIGGLKRYFQATGLMIAIATLSVTRKEMNGWMKILLIIAFMQLPFALFERIVLVALRGGIAYGGGQATDVVAGTMGVSLDGGSPNSIMVLFVLIAFAFIFSRWKEKIINDVSMLYMSIVLLMPLALGETKVVIFMFPLMSFVLLRKDIVKNPSKYLPLFALMIVFTIGLAYVYFELMLNTNLVEGFLALQQYNAEGVGYGTQLLNRVTAMGFWWGLHGWYDPISLLFGHGLGSSYGLEGHIAELYPRYGIGITTITSILWDLGVVGLLLYYLIYVTAWFQVNRIWQTTKSAEVKADCMGISVGIALNLLFTLYADSQVNLMVHEIISAVLLGYAAFLYKENKEQLIQSKVQK